MRKKLLALLMCATMVLGTGVTAMAATSTSDAEKVGSDNATNFMLEYWEADKAITSTTSNGSLGTVTYGYVEDGNADDIYHAYKPVVVYKNSKSATGYSQATKLAKAYADQIAYELKDEAIVGAKVKEVVPSLTSVKVESTANPGVKVDKTADYELVSGDKVYDSKGNLVFTQGDTPVANTSILAADYAASVYSAAAGKYAVYVQTIGGSKDLYLVDLDSTPAVVTKTSAVDGTKIYVATSAGDNLVVAKKDGIVKSTDENAFGTIWSTVSAAGKNFTANIADVQAAIDNKTFTKDAVAVKVSAYLQASIATDTQLALENTGNLMQGLAKILWNSTKIQGGQYTFDSDLISRTAFKDAAAVDVFTVGIAATVLDENYGLVKPFNKIATVSVDKTIVFDKDVAYGDGIFVFDKGTVTEEPDTDANDGVSDKPAEDNTASPKTGDVAPIAALAVVMMGAFGAMVVASKKRA